MGRIYNDTSSAHNGVAVDVSSTDQTLASGCRGLFIGTTGDVELTFAGGNKVTLPDVAAGIIPVQAAIIHNENTTATGIVALY